MIIESIISALVGMGVTTAVKTASESKPHKPSNIDRTIIGYDVLSGLYTPLPVNSTAEGFVNSAEDIKKHADYSGAEWVTTANRYDTPGRAGGVNIPNKKMNNKTAAAMLYQGFDAVSAEV